MVGCILDRLQLNSFSLASFLSAPLIGLNLLRVSSSFNQSRELRSNHLAKTPAPEVPFHFRGLRPIRYNREYGPKSMNETVCSVCFFGDSFKWCASFPGLNPFASRSSYTQWWKKSQKEWNLVKCHDNNGVLPKPEKVMLTLRRKTT